MNFSKGAILQMKNCAGNVTNCRITHSLRYCIEDTIPYNKPIISDAGTVILMQP